MTGRRALVAICVSAFLPAVVSAQVPIPLGFGQQYTQDFNTLGSTASSTPPLPTFTAVPSGWAFAETGGNPNTTYAAQNGSVSTPDTYSFGTDGSTDRAFGAFGGTGASGVTTTIGVGFRNVSNVTLNQMYVQFVTELWRKGSVPVATDHFDFSYSTNATSLTDPNATWTTAPTLNMVSPVVAASNTALDGNLAANRVLVGGGLTGLNIPVNGTVYFRWVDFNLVGREDGLGMDDFVVAPAPEPGSILGVAAGVLAAGGWVRRRRAAHRASA